MAGEVKVRQGGTGHGIAVVTVVANYNVLDTDDVVIANANGITITLPAGTAWRGSRRWVIHTAGGLLGSATVNVAGGGTIEGLGTYTLNGLGDGIEVVCDGSNYKIISALGVGATFVQTTRTINTTSPLTGGGNLSANRTFGILDFVASGASHARGAVPDPGAVAGTTKFLREDGTWAVPAGGGLGSVKWDPTQIASLLTTQLDNLAAGAGSGLGAQYDNSDVANQFLFGMFQLDVTFGSAPTADTVVSLFLVPATDGTNYNDGGTSVQPQNFAICSFNMRNVNTQQLLSVWDVVIPPTKFKLMAYNGTNQNFPASGSTVKMIPYGQRIV